MSPLEDASPVPAIIVVEQLSIQVAWYFCVTLSKP